MNGTRWCGWHDDVSDTWWCGWHDDAIDMMMWLTQRCEDWPCPKGKFVQLSLRDCNWPWPFAPKKGFCPTKLTGLGVYTYTYIYIYKCRYIHTYCRHRTHNVVLWVVLDPHVTSLVLHVHISGDAFHMSWAWHFPLIFHFCLCMPAAIHVGDQHPFCVGVAVATHARLERTEHAHPRDIFLLKT